MAGRADWEWSFSRLRRWLLRGWEPILNGALLVALAAAMLLGAAAGFWVWGAKALAMICVALVVLVRLVSAGFSRASLRTAAVMALVVTGTGVFSVGRAELVEARRRGARAAATRLGREAATVLAGQTTSSTADARARARAATDALTAVVATVTDPAARLVGGQIAAELDASLGTGLGTGPGTEPLAAAVRRAGELQAQLPAPPNPVLAFRVGAVVDAVNALVARTEVDAALPAIDGLCRAGVGAWSRVPGEPCLPTPQDHGGRDLARAPVRRVVAERQATAALALARAEVAAARDPAAATAARQQVDAREKALADALAARDNPTPAVGVVDVVREGGNAVVRRLPLVDRRDVPYELSLVGWLVVAGLAIVGYRHLEIVNGTDGLGPVRVKGPDDDIEQFRTYLMWNVREPGAVPGAGALKPVTDLLGATSAGVPGAAWLQKLIEALTAAVAIDHGYTVQFDVLSQATPTTKATVAVRVHVTRTGQLIGQHVGTQDTTREAERSAAYWAAAVILGRSRKVPDWAEWSADTSDSLAAYFERSDANPENIDKLREAVQKAPTSGLLCLDLANAEAIRGNQFQAFQLALRVATLHPRYIASRYRLAVTASLLASDLGRHWDDVGQPDREEVLAALDRYQRPPTALVAALRDDPGGNARAELLCRFGLDELEVLRTDTTRRRVVFKALRQRERSYWFELVRPAIGRKSLRAQFRQSIESCKPAVKARGDLPVEEDELRMQLHRVLDPRTLWLVPYNLACCNAIWQRHDQAHPASEPPLGHGDHAAEAVRLLEIAVERPGSFQLNVAWLDADPDLESLRNDPRFLRFRERVYRGPTRAPAPASGPAPAV